MDSSHINSSSSDTDLDLEKAETHPLPPQPSLSPADAEGRDGQQPPTGLDVVRTLTHPYRRFDHDLAKERTAPDVIVHFDGPDDPYHPLNWTFKKKVMTTVLLGFTTMGATIGTSIYSPGVEPIAENFGVSDEVATLGISLFLWGFGVGPLLWGPVSEVYGRKWSVLIPYFISAFFVIGTGASENIQTLMICRFFAGFFASAPVTNTGGVLRDMWAPSVRSYAMNGYVLSVCGGPSLGPIIGGALNTTWLGWRWASYINAIMILTVFFVDLIFVEETHPPTLLVHKAQRLRFAHGNWALHAKHEEWDVSLNELAHKYLVRPLSIISTPIGLCMCSYASFVYALFYAQLAAFPIVFGDIRGWGEVTSELPFLALLVGIFIGVSINMAANPFFQRALAANDNKPVPEARLIPMMAGSLMLTGGFFEFAWTAAPASIFWFVPMIGLALFAAGFCTIFLAALNYLIDTFQEYAASAVAANTFLRSVLAGAFPLFVSYMYAEPPAGIGPNWGASVFAFVSVLLLPIPFLFYVYGKRIRARGELSRASLGKDE